MSLTEFTSQWDGGEHHLPRSRCSRLDIYLEKSIRTLSVKSKDSCYVPLLAFRVPVTFVSTRGNK